MNTITSKWLRICAACAGILALTVGVFLTPPVFAQAVSGPTVTGGNFCMQTTFSGDTINPPNSVKLNCTANDISLSAAEYVYPETCTEGETFTLTARFRVNVTSNERYDAGFYFNIAGGDSARLPTSDQDGVLGKCSLSVLSPLGVPGLNLDSDFCGDLNAGLYTDADPPPPVAGDGVTFTIPGVKCKRLEGTNLLRLPYCTAWHSNKTTLCSANADADPEAKSKCVCNDYFTVPVIVEQATLNVVKTAGVTSVPETGGVVPYTVLVANQSAFVDVAISIIDDCIAFDAAGNCTESVDLTDPSLNPQCAEGEPSIITPLCTPASVTSCGSLIGTVLQETGGTPNSASCGFSRFMTGNSGEVKKDVVEVCGTQQGTGATVCDDDDAEVTITDVAATPTLTKTATAAACTVDVTYQVVVSNNSEIDTLTVNSLTDNKFGNIASAHAASEGVEQVVSTTCGQASPSGAGVLPYEIAESGAYSCSFVGRIVDSDCLLTHINKVTGSVVDEDGVTGAPEGSTTVTITGKLNP